MQPFMRNITDTTEMPPTPPTSSHGRAGESMYELDGIRSENSTLEDQVDHSRQGEEPATSNAETPVESPKEPLGSTSNPDSNEALSIVTDVPSYRSTDQPRDPPQETRLTNEIPLPPHFLWPHHSFVGSRSSGLASSRKPTEGRFPDPVTEYAIHFPGRKRFIALAATYSLFITYLTLDVVATAMPESSIYKNHFGHYVFQVLELVLTVLLVVITLYLLGDIVFYRPSNMQYPSIKKATKKQKCIFLTLMGFAFTPLILACILTGLHKSANIQTEEVKTSTCRDLGYSTTILLQSPSNSTKLENENSTSSAILSTKNDILRMTLSPPYQGIIESPDRYLKTVPNSIENITIKYVTGKGEFFVFRQEKLASGDIVGNSKLGFYIEEPNLKFLDLLYPVHSDALDWKYHTFSEHPDLALYTNNTDSRRPLIKVVPRSLNEDCTMLRICSTEENVTSSELLVPVGVILTELTKVAAACDPNGTTGHID